MPNAHPQPSIRSLDLAEIALESAASSCQFGASLKDKGLDPLAREYLVAAEEVAALRTSIEAAGQSQ